MGRRQHWPGRAAATAASIWLLVYGIVWLTGQGFSTNFLMHGWQLVPYPTLRDDPFGSVWYLHIQPPVWNFVLGSLGRWSPLPTAITLQLLSLSLGAVLAGTLASLLVRIDVPRRAAIVIALASTLNPPVLRLAFDAQYELAVALGIVVLLWAVAAPTSTKPAHRFIIISVVGTLIVMTRSLFHPVWLVVLLIPIANAARKQVSRRVLTAMLAIPIITIGGWMAKNQVLFGEATLSTWTGMNLQKSISPTFSQEKLQELAGRGAISDVTVIGPFQPYANYADAVPFCEPTHDEPSVAAQESSEPSIGIGGGEFFTPNYNYECFISVYDIAGDDAIYLATNYPGRWATGRLWSARTWFSSGSMNERSSSVVLRVLDDLYNVLRIDLPAPVVSTDGWQARAFLVPLGSDDLSWLVVGCTALVLFAGARHLVQRLRRRAPGGPRAKAIIVAAFVLAWTFATGVVGELGEQARFRTMTDPFVVALGIVLAASALARFGHARSSDAGALYPAPSGDCQTS